MQDILMTHGSEVTIFSIAVALSGLCICVGRVMFIFSQAGIAYLSFGKLDNCHWIFCWILNVIAKSWCSLGTRAAFWRVPSQQWHRQWFNMLSNVQWYKMPAISYDAPWAMQELSACSQHSQHALFSWMRYIRILMQVLIGLCTSLCPRIPGYYI